MHIFIGFLFMFLKMYVSSFSGQDTFYRSYLVQNVTFHPKKLFISDVSKEREREREREIFNQTFIIIYDSQNVKQSSLHIFFSVWR